jgi:CHAD domain-containing protein
MAAKELCVAFKLEIGESVEAGIRRIVGEQLQAALHEVRDVEPRKADAAVHSARKRFKRIRALVRLVRHGLGPEVFARENASFRDAGGSLSEVRDANVLVQTLDSLKEEVEAAAFTAARKRLLARRRAVKRRVLAGANNGLEAVAAHVESAQQRVAGWQIADGQGWDALEPGLKKVYRDGRTAFQRAQVGDRPELFHEWRKRVKDLWHQTEVLEAIWPDMLKPLAEEFHSLADVLGQEHDLSVLEAVLEAEALARAEAASDVIPALRTRRAGLRKEAAHRGAFLFAEKPGAFLKRMAKYWKAWKEQIAASDEPSEPESLTPAAIAVDSPTRLGNANGGEAVAATAHTVPAAGAA